MKKYNYYILSGEFEENTYENYREAFSDYARQETATLYGANENGVSTIMSK